MLLEDLDDGPLVAGPIEQVDRVRQVVGAEHHVDVAGALHDELTVLLGETPADRDLEPRLRLLQRLEPAEMPVELVVGVLPDAARVEDDDVGGLEVVGGLHPVGREQARDALRVVLVHLAPVGAQVEAARSVGRVGRCHGRSVYGRPTARAPGFPPVR